MMCMEYALLQKNAVHNLTTWKSASMVVMLVKANKTNYHISLLHHQLTFYIVMFKKEKFIPQMCTLFYSQLGVGSMGGLGREGLFTIATDGNRQKKILYAHYKYFSVCHFW